MRTKRYKKLKNSTRKRNLNKFLIEIQNTLTSDRKSVLFLLEERLKNSLSINTEAEYYPININYIQSMALYPTSRGLPPTRSQHQML